MPISPEEARRSEALDPQKLEEYELYIDNEIKSRYHQNDGRIMIDVSHMDLAYRQALRDRYEALGWSVAPYTDPKNESYLNFIDTGA